MLEGHDWPGGQVPTCYPLVTNQIQEGLSIEKRTATNCGTFS